MTYVLAPPFVYNNAHVTTGPALLIDLFRDQVAIRALVEACALEVQELEDAVKADSLAFDIITAVGDQLDAIGQILGIDRQGLIDDPYRVQLQARVVLLTSSGTRENINALVRLLLISSGIVSPNFFIRQLPPLSIEVEVRSIFTGDEQKLADLLRSAVAAGVEFRLRLAQATPIFLMDTAGAMDNAKLVDEWR